jgi:hypothetical protein
MSSSNGDAVLPLADTIPPQKRKRDTGDADSTPSPKRLATSVPTGAGEIKAAIPTVPSGEPLRASDGTAVKWHVLTTSEMMRKMVHIVSGVIPNGTFRLIDTPELHGMCMTAITSSNVCMMKANLELPIVAAEGVDLNSIVFTLPMDTFGKVMSNFKADYLLEMYQDLESADVIFVGINRFDPRTRSTCRICTLDSIIEEPPSAPDTKTSVGVDVCVGALKRVFKSFESLGAEVVGINVERHVDPSNGVVDMLFTLSAEGGSSDMKQTYHSVIQRDTQANGETTCTAEVSSIASMRGAGGVDDYCIRVLTGGDAPGGGVGTLPFGEVDSMSHVTLVAATKPNVVKEDLYSADFSCEFLNEICKKMGNQVVHLSLGDNLPLILTYPLGTDNSHVRVLLGTLGDDEDDDDDEE